MTSARIFYIILAIGLFFRFAIIVLVAPYPDRYIQSDAIGYDRIAINLVSGNGFSMKETAPFTPDNFRTPIYPFTIALCYFLFGYQPAVILWLQAFMGLLTILLVYLIAKVLIGPRVGLIAAALFSISPISILYSALLWSDTEYTLFLTLTVCLTLLMLAHLEVKWVLFGGIVAGIATLTHIRSYYLPFFFAAMLLLVCLVRKTSAMRASTHAILYLIVSFLTILPWQIRNWNEFGVPNLSSAAGINLLDYGAALTESVETGEDQWSIAQRYDTQVRQSKPTPVNEAEFSELAVRFAFSKIAQRPMSFARVQTIGMAKLFLPSTFSVYTLLNGASDIDTAQIYGAFIATLPDQRSPLVNAVLKFPPVVWVYIIFETLFLGALFLFSFYALLKERRIQPFLWVLVCIILYLIVVAGPAGAPRFRVPIMPLITVLAGCGLAQALVTLKTHRVSSTQSSSQNSSPGS